MNIMNIITNKRKMYITKITMGSKKTKKQKKNIWMDLVHNGGGSRAQSTFHVYGGWGGGVSDKLD